MFFWLLTLVAFGDPGSCEIEFQSWPDQTTILALVQCQESSMTGDCLVANAGADASGFTGQNIVMDGGATTAPHTLGELSYAWVQVENGAPLVTLNNASSATPSFATDTIGDYVFRLDAAWLCRTDSDTVTISVDVFTGPPASLNAELITTGSSDTIVQVTFAFPGDDRLFIVYKSGFIRIFESGVLLPTPFLDISGLVSGGSEQGLLGIAFDPDYLSNRFFYVNYTGRTPAGAGNTRDTRIVAYQRDVGDPNIADPAANQLLLSIGQPETNHNGGQIHFGQDGYLYIGMGDGGGAGDNHGAIGNGQDPQALLGKMLRLEVDGFNAYAIPPDNPFVGDPTTLDEIWALGLRNPWRFSFDRSTGDMYIGDVGQNVLEEIDFQPATSLGGENYGWRLKEGTQCFNPSTNCDPGGLTDPVQEYSHGGNPFRCSISGGYVYRGVDIPALDGFYIYGDFCSAQYWSLRETMAGWENNEFQVFVNDSALSSSDDITAFGEDSQGELYICTRNGSIASVYKITSIRSR